MTIGRDLMALQQRLRGVLEYRRSAREWTAHGGNTPANATLPEVIAYFADQPINLYQIRQWYGPLLRLNETRPVTVVTRSPLTAVALRSETDLPVVMLDSVGAVEAWMAARPVRIVFYVNQNIRNFQMLRLHEPAHVFLSHGESDKAYMASNQLKAYDYAFIAGEAARARLRANLVDYDVEARTVAVGRPQMDVHYPAPLTLPDDARTVVLYAPTWEGDRPSMSYSSVGAQSGQLIRALAATGSHRVIYRSHPRTGLVDPSVARAHEDLVKHLTDANLADPTAGHVIDASADFGWQLDAADVCIADISAVAFDWLATGKPIVLTEPTGSDAVVDLAGIAGSLPMLSMNDAASIVDILTDASSATQAASRAALVERYFGDVSPGAQLDRWLAATEMVIDKRIAALSAK